MRVHKAGHYILSAVDFRRDPSRSASKCPEESASIAYLAHKRPNLAHGGLHFPQTPESLYRFESPRTSAACTAVAPGDARDGSLTDPKYIAMELNVNWGRATAQQLKRVPVDSEGNNLHLINNVDEV